MFSAMISSMVSYFSWRKYQHIDQGEYDQDENMRLIEEGMAYRQGSYEDKLVSSAVFVGRNMDDENKFKSRDSILDMYLKFRELKENDDLSMEDDSEEECVFKHSYV